MASIELFAGAGGLGMGMSKAGFHHLAVVEWDSDACSTIRANQARGNQHVLDWPVHECDVRDFDFSPYAGRVEIISGGPPCQPFSLGGKHRGHLDERDMFPQAIRAVREIAPKAFIFENVKGLTRETFSNYLEYIKFQLIYPEIEIRARENWDDHYARLERYHTHGRHDGLHYRIVCRVLNAANYGIPQKRERFIIVGFRADTGIEWTFPTETHSREALLWDQWVSGEYWERHRIAKKERPEGPREIGKLGNRDGCPKCASWVTVRDAICDLPDPEKSSSIIRNIHNHIFQPGARPYPGHTGSPLDEPAKTLKAGDHGVPGGENMLLRPDGSVRYFTVMESARLQTFPDDYIFKSSWTESMRQLGNAVPVKLAEMIARNVRAHLLND